MLPTTIKMSVGIGEGYTFPSHIFPTDLRPDIALWDDTTKSVTLIKLTVCLEYCFEDVRERKEITYMLTIQTSEVYIHCQSDYA